MKKRKYAGIKRCNDSKVLWNVQKLFMECLTITIKKETEKS